MAFAIIVIVFVVAVLGLALVAPLRRRRARPGVEPGPGTTAPPRTRPTEAPRPATPVLTPEEAAAEADAVLEEAEAILEEAERRLPKLLKVSEADRRAIPSPTGPGGAEVPTTGDQVAGRLVVGAGDALAGGFMAYLARTGDLAFPNLRRAMIYGSAMGSLAVEAFGTQRLEQITLQEVHGRVKAFRDLIHFSLDGEA